MARGENPVRVGDGVTIDPQVKVMIVDAIRTLSPRFST